MSGIRVLTHRCIFHIIHCTSRVRIFLVLPITFINIPETNLVHGEPVVDEQQVFPPVVLTHFLNALASGFPQRPGTESLKRVALNSSVIAKAGVSLR